MLLSILNLLYKMLILNTFLRTCNLHEHECSTMNTCKVANIVQAKYSSSFISNADHLKARLCLYLTVKLVLAHYAGELLCNTLCLKTYSSFAWCSLRLRLKHWMQRQKPNVHHKNTTCVAKTNITVFAYI